MPGIQALAAIDVYKRQALGGVQFLIRDGRINPNLDGSGAYGGYSSPSPMTAVGVKEDGTVMLVTADGRQPGFSKGLTVWQMAQLLMCIRDSYYIVHLNVSPKTLTAGQKYYDNGEIVMDSEAWFYQFADYIFFNGYSFKDLIEKDPDIFVGIQASNGRTDNLEFTLSPAALAKNKVPYFGTTGKGETDVYKRQGLYNKKGSSGYVTAINSFMGGNSLFYIAGNGSPDINDLSALMKDDYGILPFPKGDGQKDYTCILLNNRYYGLASNNAQVEDAGKILVARCV